MAKNAKKINWIDIFKGKFLIDEGSEKIWYFLLFLMGLAIIMITSTHQIQKKITKIITLDKEVRELKSQYTDARKQLLRYQTESEIKKIAIKDCLQVATEQPFKLVIPTNNDKK